MGDRDQTTASAESSHASAVNHQVGDRAVCVCGGDIEWRLRPTIPFPDVATERQLERSGKGRWVHVRDYGTDGANEWCAPRRAVPA